MKKDNINSNPARICSVGGEALMEGIMMRAPGGYSQVVRQPDGNLNVETKTQAPLNKKNKFLSLPVVRGAAGLIDSLSIGINCLFRSAEIAGLEEEIPEEEMSKFDKWLTKKFGDKLPKIIMVVALILSLAISITLFFLLPNIIAGLIIKPDQSRILYNLIEGLVRISIFLGYMILVSNMRDIKRVFMYHGAEHKTIHCYEHMEDLTVENVRKYSKHHPRCGTAFMFVIMIISILLYSLLPRFDNMLLNLLARLALLPVIVGVGYEFNRLCGKYENRLTKILRAPGMAMQRLTTREPDDSMIMVAIVALNLALELDTSKPDQVYTLGPNGEPLEEKSDEPSEPETASEAQEVSEAQADTEAQEVSEAPAENQEPNADDNLSAEA